MRGSRARPLSAVGGDRRPVRRDRGYDPLVEIKTAAAHRWVSEVNADGRFGLWMYALAKKPEDVNRLVEEAVADDAE